MSSCHLESEPLGLGAVELDGVLEQLGVKDQGYHIVMQLLK